MCASQQSVSVAMGGSVSRVIATASVPLRSGSVLILCVGLCVLHGPKVATLVATCSCVLYVDMRLADNLH